MRRLRGLNPRKRIQQEIIVSNIGNIRANGLEPLTCSSLISFHLSFCSLSALCLAAKINATNNPQRTRVETLIDQRIACSKRDG